ncbi:MAG: glutamate--tRNA ligase [Candidatus Uhrbacteria bacterium]|nr:glutamate--tRNA ligase [Candidatus Uhrbacteria bacterium]
MRTRMAPSPTGDMHIGTLRTALYSYFLARQSNGQFIIRIEDTDRERLVLGTLESLLKTFQTLGLDHDEGPVLRSDGTLGEKGDCGPYIQSERLSLYKKYAEQLVQSGHAYCCFCTEERLTKMRADQIASKQPPKYDRLCLKLSTEEVQSKLNQGELYVIRMKIPEGESKFIDAIRGEILFQNTEVDDQVLIKSDGFPTYHLAVVVDDHLMNITHVLRGEEWISSTPKQIILHQMLNWEMPVYAHVPLILNPDKTKLSKRKGDVSVESYLKKGYLPQALINFLALLGWNPTANREIFPCSELVELFDLSKVNKSGAVMNMEKLNWMNAQYLKMMPEKEYLALCQPWLDTLPITHYALPDIDRACLLVRDRVQILSELPQLIGFLFEPSLEYDASLLLWKTQTKEDAKERLTIVREFLNKRLTDQFSLIADLDQTIRSLIVERGWQNGDTLWPLRVALSGQKQSPGPFELLVAYGKERALERIDQALAKL